MCVWDAYILLLCLKGLEQSISLYIVKFTWLSKFLFALMYKRIRTRQVYLQTILIFLKCFADSLSLYCVCVCLFYNIIIHFKFLKCFRTATLHYFYDYFYGYGVNWMISKMHCRLCIETRTRKIYTAMNAYLYEFSLPLSFNWTPYPFIFDIFFLANFKNALLWTLCRPSV